MSKYFKKLKDYSEILEYLEAIIVSIIILWLIYSTVAFPRLVVGPSMEPTLHTGERVLADKITTFFRDYKRGEIVILNPPDSPYEDYIKRVIGIPGDVVKILDCSVYISRDGEKYRLEENYLGEGTCTKGGRYLQEGRALRLEDDQYIVLGDNRTKSDDSRSFGIVNKHHIKGRVILRFWPLDKIRFF